MQITIWCKKKKASFWHIWHLPRPASAFRGDKSCCLEITTPSLMDWFAFAGHIPASAFISAPFHCHLKSPNGSFKVPLKQSHWFRSRELIWKEVYMFLTLSSTLNPTHSLKSLQSTTLIHKEITVKEVRTNPHSCTGSECISGFNWS